ncbi:ABC-2 family transporter protein [Candidatus Marsarchaeota archaeon]|nr:ABC-2 family transporter protein [Candidatus Marsarchaeota archaeon]
MQFGRFIRSQARNARVFLAMQLYAWKEILAYRASAVFVLLAIATGPLLSFIFITIIYSVSSGIAGWSYYQLLFLSSMSSFILAMLNYFSSPRAIVALMRQGGLDIYLTRPYSPYLSSLALGSIYSLSSAFTSVAIIAYALFNIGPSVPALLEFVIVAAFGLAAMISFMMVFTMVVYSLMKSARWSGNLMNVFSEFSSYPLQIYSVIGVFVFSLLVPIGLAVYYPAEILLGRVNAWVALAIVLFAVVLIYVFRKAFYHYLKNYTSAIG